MGSEHVYCTQYPMHYRQFFRFFFFQQLQSIFQRRLQYYCKNTFFLNVFFSFFAVLHVCSISFYNFFGLAVTKSLTGKGGKNCLIFSYTKGLIVLFCATFHTLVSSDALCVCPLASPILCILLSPCPQIILFFVVILVVVFFLGFATNLAKAKAHYSSNKEFVCFTGWRIATTKTMFTKV